MQKRGMTSFLGRSMVEMLGVLAIIGVLSMAALSGYQTAMSKYCLLPDPSAKYQRCGMTGQRG